MRNGRRLAGVDGAGGALEVPCRVVLGIGAAHPVGDAGVIVHLAADAAHIGKGREQVGRQVVDGARREPAEQAPHGDVGDRQAVADEPVALGAR